MPERVQLRVLFDRVSARVHALQAALPGWPCRSGCDACCKRLARVPELTRVEWELLREALEALPELVRAACLRRAELLREQVQRSGDTGPFVCPWLDEGRGVCLVYQARPLACRTYGFYASHHHDAWCERVAEHVVDARAGLVLGNLDAVERDLSQQAAERRDMLAWLSAASEA
jgi:Fe-S-cluster containining protein